jgi:hypothetical protein
MSWVGYDVRTVQSRLTPLGPFHRRSTQVRKSRSGSGEGVQVVILGLRMPLVGYDDKTVWSKLTPWDHSTAGALRFVARETESGRGEGR